MTAARAEQEADLQWLVSNQLAEKEEFGEQQRELEQTARPLLAKLYGGAGQTCGDKARAASNSTGPTVKEVD